MNMLGKPLHTAVAIAQRNPYIITLRLGHKRNQQIAEKPQPKVAADVVNYLETTPEYQNIKSDVPNHLLRKYKSPESMYLINRQTAKTIGNVIKKYLDESSLIEVNPGFGILTDELLKHQRKNYYLYESSNHFKDYLNDLQDKNPGRLSYKVADLFGMWKLAFLDKMDQGNRIKELLGELATDDKDRVVKIVGSMPGLSFVKHLINNIVFMNMNNQLGRPDLFITMPAHRYLFLTDPEIQISKYKAIPALFQLLFDFEMLTRVPKAHFLPWVTQESYSKKTNVIEDNSLYLVKISQKEKLPCPPEYLPLLWYFFKPHVFYKSTRVIPMLEQWIPGCGVWLITGQDPPETRRDIAPGAEDAPLPHMTIFTEFGDLTLAQKLTVFKRFVSWPDFDHCQFRVTMENNLPKIVTEVQDDDKDTIAIDTHLDEHEHSDSEIES